jgi:hypothetical protein
MAKEFYNGLINYVSNSDTSNANALLMKEVGKSLAKNKADFIALLSSSGVAANEYMSDIELINAFVNALPKNKTLMISTAYMINNENKFLNTDGTEKISDNGVKLSYKVMYDFFSKDDSNAEDFYNASSNVGTIAGAVSSLADLGSAGISARQKNKYSITDTLAKQEEAKSQLIKSVLAAKQKQAEVNQKQAEIAAKTKKILLIGSLSLLALVGIGIIIYKIKK